MSDEGGDYKYGERAIPDMSKRAFRIDDGRISELSRRRSRRTEPSGRNLFSLPALAYDRRAPRGVQRDGASRPASRNAVKQHRVRCVRRASLHSQGRWRARHRVCSGRVCTDPVG